MSSTTRDSQESVIFVSEQKRIDVEIHPTPVHVPETPPEIQNQNQNMPRSSQNNAAQEEDNDCFIIQETTGKNIYKYTTIPIEDLFLNISNV